MGGCRCCFRQCHVNSSKYPRMHFFRFPLKEPERFKKWRQYTKMEHMLEFSESRQKNIAICARHFRPECFMNFKMERLTTSAVPTLLRLSKDQALDYELDVENGVLVTMEDTKFKHLIPPDDFECPLHLENDKILLEKLNELRNQQTSNIVLSEEVEYIMSDSSVEYEEIIIEKPAKKSSNTVEILETIQVTAPNLKRQREFIIGQEQSKQSADGSTGSKKFRILKSEQYTGGKERKNENTIIVTSRQQDYIDFTGTDHIELSDQVIDDSNQLLLAADTFSNNNNGGVDEDIELFEIHRDEREVQYDLTCSDPDSTIVQLKTNTDTLNETQTASHQIASAQDEISNLKKQESDLRVKISLLEKENSELREYCKENKELNKKLLSLQMENNQIKVALKENKSLKEKLQECCAENNKLKEEAEDVTVLRAELNSKQEETKELKKLLEDLKCKTNEHDIRKQIENERSIYLENEMKLKDEISKLRKQIELLQQQLSANKIQLSEVEGDLANMKNGKDILIQHQTQLEESLHNIQNNFDIKRNDYRNLKSDYDNLQQKLTVLEQKYWKLQALQNQEATVSTSLENISIKSAPIITPPSIIPTNALKKAQLFNSIKRYLSASMVALLRMEMFGNSEREWKADERQVAVDVLNLGETIYKYFTDEWRFRLPPLRDVRTWLSQSLQVNDEEDL